MTSCQDLSIPKTPPGQIDPLGLEKTTSNLRHKTPLGSRTRYQSLVLQPLIFKIKTSNKFQILEDEKLAKIFQAKTLLQEALDLGEGQANSYILEEIQNLEYIGE